MSLAGKVALITGASKGIGKATALRLARDGACVVINYSSDAKSADTLVHSIGVDKALAVKADVSKVPEIEKLVKQAIDKFGKIDILIPCAGMLPMSPLESTTEELFDNIFALNVKGPYFLVQVRVRIFFTLTIVFSMMHPLTRTSESGAPYGSWLARRPHLHHTHSGFNRHATLPSLPRHQRCYRANGSSHVKRSRSKRHLRQRHLPWTDEYGAFHEEPDRADFEGAFWHEP